MRKYFFAICTCFIFTFSFGQNQQVKIKTKINEVTVFLSGAQLTSIGNGSIEPGVSELIFENLTADMDENSIQVKGEGDFTILSVTRKINYLQDSPKSKEIKTLEDSLELLQNKNTTLQNQITIYDNEEMMVLANRVVGGANTGLKAIDFKEVADFFRARLNEIRTKKIEAQLKQQKINVETIKITNQLNVLNNKREKSTSDVFVTVASKTKVSAKFVIEYLVQNASWTPFYEIRVKDTQEPIQLNLKANVYQNTGIDWANVKLNLSTGNPSLGGTMPVLSPMNLGLYKPVQTIQNRPQSHINGRMLDDGEQPYSAPYRGRPETVAYTAADYTQTFEKQLTCQYEISIPYNIPSDGDIHAVDIQNLSLKADYSYYSAPKLDKDAFLVAKVIGWDQYSLLSGPATVFYDGTYIGKTAINVLNTNDTLDLSLGRDKNIVIQRTKLKDFSAKNFIGLTKKETYVYEVSIRNKKKQEINIEIADQIPLSSTSDITIKVEDNGAADLDATTGELTWKIKLAPSEDKKVKFSYTIQYPKDKILTGNY